MPAGVVETDGEEETSPPQVLNLGPALDALGGKLLLTELDGCEVTVIGGSTIQIVRRGERDMQPVSFREEMLH